MTLSTSYSMALASPSSIYCIVPVRFMGNVRYKRLRFSL
ncbi:hypothetical protein 2011_scaffold152_00004 [Bacteriophage sp.]|nr:hypothetical protein 2011_scaffold152_00004 [Bacteriophage sp.]